MNRARNADHAARTSERFVYSMVNRTRVYDYQICQTYFLSSQELRKGLWAFYFLIVLFGCKQAPIISLWWVRVEEEGERRWRERVQMGSSLMGKFLVGEEG